jgi:hypothetical protein
MPLVRSRCDRCRDGPSAPVLSAVLPATSIRAAGLDQPGCGWGVAGAAGGRSRAIGRRRRGSVGSRLPGAMRGGGRRHSARRRSRGNRTTRTMRRADPRRPGSRRLAPSKRLNRVASRRPTTSYGSTGTVAPWTAGQVFVGFNGTWRPVGASQRGVTGIGRFEILPELAILTSDILGSESSTTLVEVASCSNFRDSARAASGGQRRPTVR